MMELTLDEAKNYLRVDFSDDDALITSLIAAAESYVAEVSRADAETMEAYASVVHAAKLYAVAYLYEHREEADHGELIRMLCALLFPIRQEAF